MDNKMEKLVALAKRRGFFYPGSELYGGLANTYDYGPMGTELFRNIKNLWWENFVTKRADMVGLDAGIISHHKIWEASGHVAGFADAMIDCKNCKARMRADHLIENHLEQLSNEELQTQTDLLKTKYSDFENNNQVVESVLQRKVEGLSLKELEHIIHVFNIPCPNCKAKPLDDDNWTSVRKFNLLFPVQLGIVEGEGGSGYLRGETAQGMFVNFQNVINSTRVRLPFGIAQLGKSFRNEITPGNAIFRTIEFEQGEIEYFFDHTKTNWETLFESWKEAMYTFVTEKLGIKKENLRWRAHTDEERSFYSKRTEDLEYDFPFGYKELWGLAYRTNYDLTAHQEASKKDLTITDPQTGEKILPHVIEPAVGMNRLLLMVLADAYEEESSAGSLQLGSGQADQEKKRTVLKLHPSLAPVKVAVFPLLANKEHLVAKAREVYETLQSSIAGKVLWDDRGNIGKRYLSQDEVGTPFCVTVDFQTIEEDNAVTVRDRNTTAQERVKIENLVSYLQEKLQ